jgi:hypothetical protein
VRFSVEGVQIALSALAEHVAAAATEARMPLPKLVGIRRSKRLRVTR